MVSWSGHVLPVILTLVFWFVATGLIAWLDNLDRRTFGRSLLLAGVAGIAGLAAIFLVRDVVAPWAVYAGFGGALLVWSWLEIGFLTGAVAGPRSAPCPPGARGWERLSYAAATLIYHEVALVVTALLLISITWNSANQIGAIAFVLFYVLRLSTKLNIYWGVPNSGTDILPDHLRYLTTYYGPSRLQPGLIVSILAIVLLAAWLGWTALQVPPGGMEAEARAISASLLFALAALGAIEHLFLALPFRDGALWGWALPKRADKGAGKGPANHNRKRKHPPRLWAVNAGHPHTSGKD